jgi:hypothetical protein
LKLKGPAPKSTAKHTRKDNAANKLSLLQASSSSASTDPNVKQTAKQEARAGKKELQACLSSTLSEESSSTEVHIRKLLESNSLMVESELSIVF